MKLSDHNIVTKIKDTDNYILLNVLSGNADILDKDKAAELLASGSFTDVEEYREKGYLVDEKDEKSRFNMQYLDFIDTRDTDEAQIFFVPWYACNFNCSYCYQESYTNEPKSLDRGVVDAFFTYITETLEREKKYITLFGGEPLLGSPAAMESIEYILVKAKSLDIDVAIVTNGYLVTEYIEILKRGRIREVQITLDGTREIHDNRRRLKNDEPTFDMIVAGVDACLDAGLPVNLRVVVDKKNFGNLEDLAALAIEKGWTANSLFKTQLGRNYNLHTCQTAGDDLFTRLELYEELYGLIRKYPDFLQFNKPAFSIVKYLQEYGELPKPLFDSCPACKTEWAFDYTGKIYPCTATVGKAGEAVGSFYPGVSHDEDAIEAWQDRDVTVISECRDCNLRLACGGGCGSVAKNETGSVNGPDCRPIKELIELGIGLYFREESS